MPSRHYLARWTVGRSVHLTEAARRVLAAYLATAGRDCPPSRAIIAATGLPRSQFAAAVHELTSVGLLLNRQTAAGDWITTARQPVEPLTSVRLPPFGAGGLLTRAGGGEPCAVLALDRLADKLGWPDAHRSRHAVGDLLRRHRTTTPLVVSLGRVYLVNDHAAAGLAECSGDRPVRFHGPPDLASQWSAAYRRHRQRLGLVTP